MELDVEASKYRCLTDGRVNTVSIEALLEKAHETGDLLVAVRKRETSNGSVLWFWGTKENEKHLSIALNYFRKIEGLGGCFFMIDLLFAIPLSRI